MLIYKWWLEGEEMRIHILRITINLIHINNQTKFKIA